MLKETIERSSDLCDTNLTQGETDGNHGCVEEVSVKGTTFLAGRRASSGDLSSMLRS